jgi:transcriptional regulator with XRE-family HTH domain
MSKSIHGPERLVLSELLISARKSARLTQQQVAEKLGRPQSFVAMYEGGECRLDVLELIAVARAVGRDPVDFFAALIGRT